MKTKREAIRYLMQLYGDKYWTPEVEDRLKEVKRLLGHYAKTSGANG